MKKTLLTVAFILILAAAIYFLILKKDKPKVLATNTGLGSTLDPGTSETANLEANPMPLRVGSGYVVGSQANTLVKDIQDALNTRYKANLITDGKFGPKTLAALLANKFPGLIYWKQYKAITGKTLLSNGAEIPADASTNIFTTLFQSM